MTKNSKIILDIVNSSRDHLTAEQIFIKAKEISPGIVLATVYNNLNLLTREHYIRRLTVQGKPDCYDNTTVHDHMVCNECGTIADVTIKDLKENLMEAVGDAFVSYDLNIYYICDKCKSAAQGEQV